MFVTPTSPLGTSSWNLHRRYHSRKPTKQVDELAQEPHRSDLPAHPTQSRRPRVLEPGSQGFTWPCGDMGESDWNTRFTRWYFRFLIQESQVPCAQRCETYSELSGASGRVLSASIDTEVAQEWSAGPPKLLLSPGQSISVTGCAEVRPCGRGPGVFL